MLKFNHRPYQEYASKNKKKSYLMNKEGIIGIVKLPGNPIEIIPEPVVVPKYEKPKVRIPSQINLIDKYEQISQQNIIKDEHPNQYYINKLMYDSTKLLVNHAHPLNEQELTIQQEDQKHQSKIKMENDQKWQQFSKSIIFQEPKYQLTESKFIEEAQYQYSKYQFTLIQNFRHHSDSLKQNTVFQTTGQQSIKNFVQIKYSFLFCNFYKRTLEDFQRSHHSILEKLNNRLQNKIPYYY